MWNTTLSLSLTHFRTSYLTETQHAKHKLHSCKLYIAPRWTLWSNLSRTACPCRITRACTSIRSVYLFNDHERPSETPGGVEWTITSCFDVFASPISVCSVTALSSTLKLVSVIPQSSHLAWRPTRNDEGGCPLFSVSLVRRAVFLATGGGFNDTNIIAFSNRCFSPNIRPWFHRFLSVLKKWLFLSLLKFLCMLNKRNKSIIL